MHNQQTAPSLASYRQRRMNLADEVLGPPLARGQASQAAMKVEDREITFGELNARVNRVGNALKPWLERGDRAMLMLNDSPDFVAAFFGIMRMGGVAGPLSTRLAAQDLAFVLRDSQAKVVLLEENLLAVYQEAAKQIERKPDLIVVRGTAPAGMVSLQDFVEDASPELETAPTTADEHGFSAVHLGHNRNSERLHARPLRSGGRRSLHALVGRGPRTTNLLCLEDVLRLRSGSCSSRRPAFWRYYFPYEGTPDAATVVAMVARYQPHIVATVPTMYRNLLREGFAEQPDFRNVRHYLSSGEGLPEGIYRKWSEATGVAIFDGLGSTETIYQYVNGAGLAGIRPALPALSHPAPRWCCGTMPGS